MVLGRKNVLGHFLNILTLLHFFTEITKKGKIKIIFNLFLISKNVPTH